METGIACVATIVAATTLRATPTDARRTECERRAAALVEKMTGEERVAQLMMDSPAIERLDIPRYHWWNEALHGVARAGLATVFPQSIGLGATFDARLMRRVGDVVSTEARAKHNLFVAQGRRGIYQGLTLWSPNVNMFRDPRWGRGQETFGEDPFLSGAMGEAYVRGLQGDDPRYLKTAACAKHFAVHSGPEALRHGFDARASARDLNEYYLPAFRRLVTDARVESVMGAYSALNGTPCCANRWLLTDLLRGTWGFRGHVVSDVGAVQDISEGHRYITNRVASCRAAIAAGLDLCTDDTYESLREALKDGTLPPEELAPPLVRLYTSRLLLGLLDPRGSTPWDGLGAKDVATPENRALALEAAEKSIVLVANNGILPLDVKTTDRIGVVGPRANDGVALQGNYCGFTDAAVTVLSGIVGEAGSGMSVWGRPEDAESGDVLVVCLGITAEDEGEQGCVVGGSSDRTRYQLPEGQLEQLRKWRKAGKRIVSVVFGGSPFDLKEVCALSDAVMLCWYPGEQGGRAVAKIIFGKANPSGRLPMTFPDSYDDLPKFEDYSLTGRTYLYATRKPAYPFGYGLSYTTFGYDGLEVSQPDGRIQVSVRVTNTGRMAGEEVVQLYVRAPEGSGDRRIHHLEGFDRVSLNPGESRVVTFELERSSFAVFGEDGAARLPSGRSEIFVGGGQPGFAPCVKGGLSLLPGGGGICTPRTNLGRD